MLVFFALLSEVVRLASFGIAPTPANNNVIGSFRLQTCARESSSSSPVIWSSGFALMVSLVTVCWIAKSELKRRTGMDVSRTGGAN
jgi:hypothetical protein